MSPQNTQAPVVRRKITKAIETGFHCAFCGYDCVVFDTSTPTNCFNCGTAGLTQAWKNMIINNVQVEILPNTPPTK